MVSGKLVLALLITISGYTGYAVPGDMPRITAMSHEALALQVCGRPCQVFGFTLPSGEIILDEALSVESDPAATSILVHELTHFLQIRSDAHAPPVTCQIWRDREREAFEVQTRWLREASGSIGTFSSAMSRLNLAAVHARCSEAPDFAPPKSWPKG